MCGGCCRLFDGRSRSHSKRAASCPEAGQVARRRTLRDATQLVCRLLVKTVCARRRRIKSVVFTVRLFLQVHTCTNAKMQSTHATLNMSHILSRCHDRRSHDVATRAGEVCLCGRRVAGEQAGTVRDVQKESGSEWNFVLRVWGADVDGRHDIQHEITRHDRACCAKTPRNMTVRTASIMEVRATLRHAMPRCDCTSLHTRSTWRQTYP